MAKAGDTLKIFVPINKIDEEQRLVYGQAAAEVLDNSGEMFDYDGSKPYFEKWSENAFATSGGKSHGNIRVMHTSKVAGIVNAPLGFDDDAKTIDCVAKVVDDAEWAMVLAGGYTGFSMGGRYVSRAKKADNITRYVAEPVEISLVDKPCIPTATFSVVKADGLVEEHRFREDLYKTDTGEASMSVPYVPTNDEILPVAQGLAKAAGQPETAWLDFVEPATAELIAKHAEAEAAPASPSAPEPAPDGDAAPVVKADDAHDTEKCDKADCPDCAAAKADKPFPPKKKEGEDGDEAAEGEDEEDKDKKAAKSDFAELQQGWRSKDGTFFVAKGDAIAHNETLTKGEAEPSLADRLETMRKSAAAVLAGEVPEGEVAPDATALKAVTIAAIADPLAKFKAFADNTLVKGMYSIRRLAEVIAGLEDLHCMVACEEAWEDDQTSKLPQMLLDGMKQLGQTLVAMAIEEVNEMVASSAMMDSRDGAAEGDAPIVIDTVIVELSASTLGLEKGAFLTEMKDRVQKRAPVEPLPDTLAKVAGLEQERDAALAKAETATGELAKIEPLVKGLQDQMDQILKMPRDKAPTTRVVGKGDTIETLAPGGPGPGAGTAADLLSKFTPDQITDAAIRLSQQHGRHFVLPNAQG